MSTVSEPQSAPLQSQMVVPGKNVFTQLPEELFRLIVSSVDRSSLLRLRLTCKEFVKRATPLAFSDHILLVPSKSLLEKFCHVVHSPFLAHHITSVEYSLLGADTIIGDVHHFLRLYNDSGSLRQPRTAFYGQFFPNVIRTLKSESVDEDYELQLLSDILDHLPKLECLKITFPKPRLTGFWSKTKYQALLRDDAIGEYNRYIAPLIAAFEVPTDLFGNVWLTERHPAELQTLFGRLYRVLEAAGTCHSVPERIEALRIPRVRSRDLATQLGISDITSQACLSLKHLLVQFADGEEQDGGRRPEFSPSVVRIIPDLQSLSITTTIGLHRRMKICLDDFFTTTLCTSHLQELSLSNLAINGITLIQLLRANKHSLKTLEISDSWLLDPNSPNSSSSSSSWIAIIVILRTELNLDRVRLCGELGSQKASESWSIRRPAFSSDQNHDSHLETRIKSYITHQSDEYPPDLQDFADAVRAIDRRTINWGDKTEYLFQTIGDDSWSMGVRVWRDER